MFVLPGYKIRHDVLLMWKITACFHAVNTETVSMVWTCGFARKWTGLCMGVLLNGHLPGVFLALKKHLSSSLFVGAFTAFLLSGNIVGIASGSSMALPYQTGCKGPVQSMSARSVHYIRMSVPSVPTTSLWSASL